jgi:hypothetical protein
MEDVNVNRENVVDIDFGLDDFVINHPCTSLQMLISRSCERKVNGIYLPLIDQLITTVIRLVKSRQRTGLG